MNKKRLGLVRLCEQTVDLWFAEIERDTIARGVSTLVKDLKKKLVRGICKYNKYDQ